MIDLDRLVRVAVGVLVFGLVVAATHTITVQVMLDDLKCVSP